MRKKKVEPEVRVYESTTEWHKSPEARAHWVKTEPSTSEKGYQMYIQKASLRPRVKTVLLWVAKPWCVLVYPNRKSADSMHAFLEHAKKEALD